MTTYIGMDAHSKTCVFVAINGRGQQVAAKRIETSEKNIRDFVRSIKGKKALTFEESTMARWLFPLLKDEVEELTVCNPFLLGRRAGPKDDFPDALHLAQQLRGNFLKPVFHIDNALSDLKSAVSAYRDVVWDHVRIKNRYKALFRSAAINTDGTTIYTDRQRIKELPSKTDQIVAAQMFLQLEAFAETKRAYVDHLKACAKKIPEIKSLSTIPGISIVRASIIASAICAAERFESKHKLWSYAMLVRHEKRSDGRSYGRARVRARIDLKEAFMGAAESVLLGQTSLRAYYDEQRKKGKTDREAKKNLARKIAAISLKVMKDRKSYRENHEAKEVRRLRQV